MVCGFSGQLSQEKILISSWFYPESNILIPYLWLSFFHRMSCIFLLSLPVCECVNLPSMEACIYFVDPITLLWAILMTSEYPSLAPDDNRVITRSLHDIHLYLQHQANILQFILQSFGQQYELEIKKSLLSSLYTLCQLW